MKRHIKAGEVIELWMINHSEDHDSPERQVPTDAIVVRTHRNHAFVVEPDSEDGFGRLAVDHTGVTYEYRDKKKKARYCAVIIKKDGNTFDAHAFIED